MPSRTQRIAQYSFERVLKEMGALYGKLQKIPKELLSDLAYEMAEIAQEKFADADYAGPQAHIDEIVRSLEHPRQTKKGNWSVQARGRALLWIEYGTGVEGESSDVKGTVPENYDYRMAEPPSRPESEDYWYFYSDENMTESEELMPHDPELILAPKVAVDEDGLEYDRTREERIAEGTMGRDRWSTTGNPANNCMYDAFEQVAEDVPDRIEEYMSK